jgi:hypothetical protein
VRQPRPNRIFGASEPTVAFRGEFLVECTVCHIVGLVERPPLASTTPWASVRCVFTDGCTGHMWPDALN